MKLIYVKTTGKTYYAKEDGTIMDVWRGYHSLRCSHGYYRYPKVCEDFREIDKNEN